MERSFVHWEMMEFPPQETNVVMIVWMVTNKPVLNVGPVRKVEAGVAVLQSV